MQLSLLSILPDFTSLIHDFGSSASISAIFWLVEMGVFLYFIVRLCSGWKKSSKNISFIQNLLKGATREGLVSKRRTLKEKAKEHRVCKGLWHEFDETLVPSNSGEILYNTYDASHFFNTHTLASIITESRLLAAVPGFLTAIGVIGTFLGLQLGLGALNLNTGDTEQLKSAISALISSASIAFMTSVWGVLLSLLFNAFEKSIEGKIRTEIASLQQRIDELFPRLIAEQTLLDISKAGHQSKETLMGLAEQIGDRMQIAVRDMADSVTTGMESSLQRLMGPAIEQMVNASTELANKQANSSEEALKGLLGQFMDGMGKAGANQQTMMQQATQDMNSSMEAWSSGMNQFLGQLNLTVHRFEDMTQQQNAALSEQINHSLTSHKDSTEFVTDQMKTMASRLMDDVKAHQAQIANAEQQRLDNLSHQLEASGRKQAEELQKLSSQSQSAAENFHEGMRHTMETLLEDYQTRQKAIADGDVDRQTTLMNELGEFIKLQKTQVTESMEKASSINDSFAQKMQHRMAELAAQEKERDELIKVQIEDMQTNVAFLIEDMRKAMEGHIQSVKAVVQQASALNDGIQRNQSGLNNATENLITVSHQMEKASEHLHKGHQEIARATDGIAGTLSLATSAVTKTSQQNALVAEGLQSTLESLETLSNSLDEISEDIRIGAENADNASREFSSNHARYRQEMQDTISRLHEQLGDLLSGYAKQVQDQTSHRMEEWNRHTQEYVNGMQGVVSVMQELVDDMDNRRVA